jgi:hypothetical protein
MDYQRLYEYRFRDVDQAARQAVWDQVAAFLYERMARPERLLDAAAGRCEFINATPALERWAVDETSYDEGSLSPGVKLVVSEIMEAQLPADHFDGVFVSNFLEHLTSQDAVAAFLSKMHSHMSADGRIAIMGPNFRYCMNEYFDMADHTVILTHKAVAEHLYAAGFEVESVVPRFLPYSFTGRLPSPSPLVRLYLAVPLVWRLLGKQFLVIGRKTKVYS